MGGSDLLDGGAGGLDRLFGGLGNDTFLARNKNLTLIDCGAGRDTLKSRDTRDRPSSNCEQ